MRLVYGTDDMSTNSIKYKQLSLYPTPKFPIIWRESTFPDLIMRAACFQEHGGDSVIECTNFMLRPKANVGQVLIRVHTAGVNSIDIKLRNAAFQFPVVPLPKIVGSDLCGTVVDTDNITSGKFEVGDRVMAMMPLFHSGWGASCEYVAVHEQLVCKVPSTVSNIEAAAVPFDGIAVLKALKSFMYYHQGDTAGRRVLIQDGASGFGIFAIQYCKNELNMVVYATCTTAQVSFVKGLGADVVIDSTHEIFEDVAVGMDVVLDTKPHQYEQRTLHSDVLKLIGSFYVNIPSVYYNLPQGHNGNAVTAVVEMTDRQLLRKKVTRFFRNCLFCLGCCVAHYDSKYVRPDGEMLEQVAQLVEAGKVRAVVLPENVFPLEQTAAAHRKLSEGLVQGKAVITVPMNNPSG